jgi:hypothetical protein
MTAQGVTKYLNLSPTTAKGHMKQPHQGICNAQPKPTSLRPLPQMELLVLPLFQEPQHYPVPAYGAMQGDASSNSLTHCTANIVDNDDSPRNAKLFFFAAFADKHTGTSYNNLTGSFPFQSFKGNVCFLVVYPYETNVILALPINGFSNKIIFVAY